MTKAKTAIWDFEGTLARRPGLWSGAVLTALDDLEPDHTVRAEDLRPHLQGVFPWHHPDVPHPELDDPDAWWEHVGGILARALDAVGRGGARADRIVARARAHVLDPASYVVFEDTRPVLSALQDAGWKHVVLSNHTPELEDIVVGLGLDDLVFAVLTSARIGYEKPHPKAFEIAREACGRTSGIWMIGDTLEKDVAGAEQAGIPAILVRGSDPGGVRHAADLRGALAILAPELA